MNRSLCFMGLAGLLVAVAGPRVRGQEPFAPPPRPPAGSLAGTVAGAPVALTPEAQPGDAARPAGAPPQPLSSAESRVANLWNAHMAGVRPQSFALAVPHYTAQTILARTPSPTAYHYDLFDRQSGAPRAGNAFLDRPKTTFIFPLVSAVANPPAGDPNVAAAVTLTNAVGLTPTATVRFDTSFDSARVGSTANAPLPGGFYPSTVPVRGDPTYGLGQHAIVTIPTVATQVGLAASTDTSLGTATLTADLVAAATDANFQPGGTSANFLHLYGQVGNFYAGKTDTAFSDVDAFPATINPAGPNAAVYLQHAAAGYAFVVWENSRAMLSASAAVEAPETSTTPFDYANSKSYYTNRSQLPDFAGRVRLTDSGWGHVQAATVLREVGIENGRYTPTGLPTVLAGHEDAFGWGIMLSGAVHPFGDAAGAASDYFSFTTVYGRGIGNYIQDLRVLGGYDGFQDAQGKLDPIPVLSYAVGYTHYWSPKWRTTAAYSEVDAYSIAQPAGAPAPYRHGRYASVNLMRFWDFDVTRPATANGKMQSPGRAFAGVEFMYGERTNLDGMSGSDRRIEVTVGYQY